MSSMQSEVFPRILEYEERPSVALEDITAQIALLHQQQIEEKEQQIELQQQTDYQNKALHDANEKNKGKTLKHLSDGFDKYIDKNKDFSEYKSMVESIRQSLKKEMDNKNSGKDIDENAILGIIEEMSIMHTSKEQKDTELYKNLKKWQAQYNVQETEGKEKEKPENKSLPAMVRSFNLDTAQEHKSMEMIVNIMATFTDNERIFLANLSDKIAKYKRPINQGGYDATAFDLNGDTSHMSRNIGKLLDKFKIGDLKSKLLTLSNKLHSIKGGSVANKVGINTLLERLSAVIREQHPELISIEEGDIKMKERGKAGRRKQKGKKSKKSSKKR